MLQVSRTGYEYYDAALARAKKNEETQGSGQELYGAYAEDFSAEGVSGGDELYLSEASKEIEAAEHMDKAEEEAKINAASSKPEDSSSQLTRRLVSALGQFEVRQVLADVNKNLVQLRMYAATAKGDDAKLAERYIKKLEKLLSRGNKKIEEINKEDMMKLRQVRAERQKQKERAEEIKTELRRRLRERKNRENGYLLEDMQESVSEAASGAAAQLDSGSEAAITVQAEAMAAAEFSAAGFNAGDMGGGFDVSGAESFSAGEAAAAPAEGGGVDIAV